MKRRRLLSFLLLIPILLLSAWSATAQGLSTPLTDPPPPAGSDLIAALDQATGGKASVSYHSETGKVRFIGTDSTHPISAPGVSAASADPEHAARAFLDSYGELFGLSDPAKELDLTKTKAADRGHAFTRFQQVYQGVPVLAGEMIVEINDAGQALSASGEVLPSPKVDVTPSIGAEVARQSALEQIAKGYGEDVSTLVASDPELWIYNPALLGAPGPRQDALVWRLEVSGASADTAIRELVLVDAQRGFVALHFNQVDTAEDRWIYDNNNNWTLGLPGNGPVRKEGQGATGVADVDKAYDYLGDTYDFYLTNHGRDSLDNAGMSLVATVRYCPNSSSCPYGNAFWNGAQMVFGAGYASADDVVAHELTHGVTERESHLFYYMQSGAINESLSDIWGELVDLSNGKGNDGASVRWLMGEDLGIGAIRSMSNPTVYPYHDPDRMTSSLYLGGYDSTIISDNGGVHTNSGVGNKAAYLITDGGSFNGKSVTGLGIAKVARIYYDTQVNRLVSGSDYADLYNALQQSCAGLTGTAGITAADCQQVKNALDAVEMSVSPTNAPTAADPPVCGAGQMAINLWSDDLENTNAGKWQISKTIGSTGFYYPQNTHPYSNFDATYATSGQYNIFGDDPWGAADYQIAMTQSVALPAGSSPYFRFNHAYQFEGYDNGTRYDGGIVEYSTDGGATWQDLGSRLTGNGYSGAINGSATGNFLAGQQAFAGMSNGYVQSRADLSTLAGQSARFRFRIGANNNNVGDWGWYIDDVRIYTCVTAKTVHLPLTLKPGS